MFSGQDSGNEKKGAKQGLSTKAGAQRRERHLQQVRHRATGEAMQQLRRQEDPGLEHGVGDHEGVDPPSHPLGPLDVWAYDSSSSPITVPLALLPQCAELAMHGATKKEVFQGVLLIRKMLSVETNVPFKEVKASGVVQHLVEYLQRFDAPDLQFECAWAITNLLADVAPDSSRIVLDCGGVVRLIDLLRSDNIDCQDQAIWALGNLAGDSTKCRDACLNSGAMTAVLEVLSRPDLPLRAVRNGVWAVSNLCRGRPFPALEKVAMAAPVMSQFLTHHDNNVVVDATWGLSYLSDGPPERVQLVVDCNVLPRVIELMSGPSSVLKTPALRIVGNIASGEDEQTQTLINAGALPYFLELLRHPKRAIRKEACWTISNISAGEPYQIEALFNAGVFQPLLECLSAPELDVRKEAVWAIANVAFCGTREQTNCLVSYGVVPMLCDVLRVYDAKIASVALEALQVILQYSQDDFAKGLTAENVMAKEILDCGGVEHIEQLQIHSDQGVYQLAMSILEAYFGATADGIGGAAGGFPNDEVEENRGMDGNEAGLLQGAPFQFQF